ncbi:MAG: methyltransferase domain-containing protein [Ignavibacteriae bacterium]|nr:methyltransferase domain-containing protein [Ignavibacteriota bacterium]
MLYPTMKAKSIIKNLFPDFVLRIYLNYRRKKELKEYSGSNVECPICKSKFKVFADFGKEKRKNARCINCGSLERTRLLWKYFADNTELLNSNSKIKLLHFAPEKPFFNEFTKLKNIEYTPCDLFPNKYNHYKSNTKITKADITDIPFDDNTFDVVLCNHVLEHISDDRLAMAELFRVMQNGGWGIFQVPIDYKREITYEDPSIISEAEREKAFGQFDHVRLYGLDYKNRLEESGFKVIADNFIEHYSDEELYKFGFVKPELIYFCEK